MLAFLSQTSPGVINKIDWIGFGTISGGCGNFSVSSCSIPPSQLLPGSPTWSLDLFLIEEF